MKQIMGVGAAAGFAIGNAVLYTPRRQLVARSTITDVRLELKRFEGVRRLYGNELAKLYTRTLAEMDQEAANIFAMYRELVEDPTLSEAVEQRMRAEHVNLEYALYYEGKHFQRMLGALEDAYLRERGTDIMNVCYELIRLLGGEPDAKAARPARRGVIVVADSFDPAAIVSLDKSVVRGVVAQRGSVFSHAAILARARGIPAIVGATEVYETVAAGQSLALNGVSGELVVEPDEKTCRLYRALINAGSRQNARYESAANERAVTLDGHEVRITAEIVRQADLSLADWRMFDGVGLYRTEFIFMTRDTLPSEEFQFQAYKALAEHAQGKDVVISVADIGRDWRCESLAFPEEENPSLGMSGVRYLLRAKEMLHTQLRAIVRASAYGRVKLLVPMLARVDELRMVRVQLRNVMKQLHEEGVTFNPDLPLGALIETPAAVAVIDGLASECDFISIGSSDLTQYLLAVDRTNPPVAHLFDPYDTAVLRSIACVAHTARQAGVPVSICGAAAYENALVPLWVALGIDELVVPNTMAGKMRSLVRRVSTHPVLAAMDDIMNSENPRETRRLLTMRSGMHRSENAATVSARFVKR